MTSAIVCVSHRVARESYRLTRVFALDSLAAAVSARLGHVLEQEPLVDRERVVGAQGHALPLLELCPQAVETEAVLSGAAAARR